MKNSISNFRKMVLTFLCLIPMIIHSQTWLWTNTAGRYNDDNGECTVIDSSGNIYVAGYFRDTITLGTTTLISAGNSDILLAKYSPNGSFLWAASAGGIGEDVAGSIAVDAQGNVFIGGWFSNTCYVGTNSFVSRGGNDLFLGKISSTGTPQWIFVAGGTGTDKIMGITTDRNGNCLVTGSFQTTLYFGTQTYNSPGSDETFVARFSPSGSPQWFLQGGFNTSDCWPSGIGRDRDNNAYIAGAFKINATFGSTTLSSNGNNSNIYIAKIDTGGHFKWAKTVAGPLDDFSNGLIADDSGYVYVTGSFFDTLTFPNFSLPSAGSKDGFVIQLDSAGNFRWAHNMGGLNQDKGIEVGIDNKRNCYVTGFINGTAHFNNKIVTGYGGDDIFIAKYTSTGALKWVELAGGTGSDYGMGLGSDYSGNIAVTGSFQNRSNFGGTFKNSTGGKDFYITKLTVKPIIKLEPVAASQCAGIPQTFKIKVTGEPPLTYRWQRNGIDITGAPNDTFLTIINPGSADSALYRCIVKNAYGSDTSLQALFTVYRLPVVKLGPDTSFCKGVVKKLDAGKGFTNYNWSTGATTQTLNVSNTATLWVTVKDNHGCSSKADTINITVFQLPLFKLGNDTSFCKGDSVVLNAGTGFAAYEWSDGFSGQYRTVKTTSTLWLSVRDTTHGCLSLPDTINVTVNQLPLIKNLKDTAFCKGPVITLDEGATTGYNYTWYYLPGNITISNSHQILTDSSGNYVVVVSNNKGCFNYDSARVTVYNLPPKPVITASGPTEFCAGDSVLLSAPTGYSAYKWSDNSVNREIIVKVNTGIKVIVIDQHDCQSPPSDTTVITVFPLPPKPQIIVPADSAACQGDSIQLQAPGTFNQYHWSTGESTSAVYLKTTQKVTLYVTDQNGCNSPESDSQSVTIYSKPSKPHISRISTEELECSVNADFYSWLHGSSLKGKKTAFAQHSKIIDNLISPSYYWVLITDSNGCVSDTSDAFFYEHGSIRENNIIKLEIKPNPANDHIYLSVQSLLTNEIVIYDYLGKMMSKSEYKITGNSIEIKNLPQGFYMIILMQDDRIYTGKFIRQ